MLICGKICYFLRCLKFSRINRVFYQIFNISWCHLTTVIQFSTSFISNSLKIWFLGIKLAKNAFVLTRNLRKICDCLFLNPSPLKSSCLALRSAETFPRSQKSLRTAERTFRSPYFRFIVDSRRNIRQFTGVGPNIHEGSKFSVNILTGGSIFWGGVKISRDTVFRHEPLS